MEIQVIKLIAIFLFLIETPESALVLAGTAAVENECYKTASVLCSNYTYSQANTSRGCESQTVTDLGLYGRGYYIITFNEVFPDSELDLYAAEFTSFSLCHCEALALTVNHLEHGQRCSVSKIAFLQNQLKVQCNNFPLMLTNITIILFKLSYTAAEPVVCMNMSLTKYRFAIIDISGKTNITSCCITISLFIYNLISK